MATKQTPPVTHICRAGGECGNHLGCESARTVDILDIKVDEEIAVPRPLENVGHDPRLSKTARSHEVNVIPCHQLPDALDEVSRAEQPVVFRPRLRMFILSNSLMP
jgi:hypothetical protein